MEVSGEYRVVSSAEKIRSYFEDPEKLRKTLTNCSDIEVLDAQTTLVTFRHFQKPGEFVQYLYRFGNGDTEREFTLSWKGTDPDSVISTGKHFITVETGEGFSILKHRTSIILSMKGQELETGSDAMIGFNKRYFENVVACLEKEDGIVAEHEKSGLNEALHKAEDAVVELEHEAEEAAARGFLGGAPMWGWIALGLLVIALLVFFR